jgi:amino acid transporter
VKNINHKTHIPICSIIGLGLFAVTLIVHICFKYNSKTTDVGMAMLLSLANALLLVFTLLWSLIAILEFLKLIKENKNLKRKLKNGMITGNEYKILSGKNKVNLLISVSYLVILLCQLGYVIGNWEEVNI